MSISNNAFELVLSYSFDFDKKKECAAFCCGYENCGGCNVVLTILVSEDEKLLKNIAYDFNFMYKQLYENKYNNENKNNSDNDSYDNYGCIPSNLLEPIYHKIKKEYGVDISNLKINQYSCCGPTLIDATVRSIGFLVV